MALPVGANQTGFLEQFAAAGLKDSIGVVSSNYGSGNQQVVVSPAAAEAAGTAEPDAVIAALESGIAFEAPIGTVTTEAGSHHLRQNIYIVRGNADHAFDTVEVIEVAAPSYEYQVCDLVSNPGVAAHFTPETN
ncbi:MAG: transporter substrate-binding protein [Pseudoruegeria sp.]